MDFYHGFFGLVSFGIGFVGTAVYIASIFRGETRPHVYTHLVWGLSAAIAFFAQLADHAGPGSWAIGITAASCLFQSLLALKYGEKNITLSDKIALVTAFAAIASWVMTKDPLLSVILSMAINLIAFYPTCRKSWDKPWQENMAAYNIASVKMAISVVALTNYSFVTTFYPIACLFINLAFVGLCLWRRKVLGGTPAYA